MLELKTCAVYAGIVWFVSDSWSSSFFMTDSRLL